MEVAETDGGDLTFEINNNLSRNAVEDSEIY